MRIFRCVSFGSKNDIYMYITKFLVMSSLGACDSHPQSERLSLKSQRRRKGLATSINKVILFTAKERKKRERCEGNELKREAEDIGD